MTKIASKLWAALSRLYRGRFLQVNKLQPGGSSVPADITARAWSPVRKLQEKVEEKRRHEPYVSSSTRETFLCIQREKQESDQFEKPPMAITNSRWHWRTTGWEKKEKKLQEEKSVKLPSSSILRKMPHKKPTESNLKICDSSISQNDRKLMKISSQ